MQLTARQLEIIEIVKRNDNSAISQIKDQLSESISVPTLNRDLADLVAQN